jgi:Ca2+:H+ antiporter
MNIDSIKRRARHESWKRDDPDSAMWDKWNPFGRTNSRTSTTRGDIETGRPDLQAAQSEPAVPTTGAAYSSPPRANTFDSPVDSISTQGAGENITYYNPSNDSNATIVNGDDKAGLKKRGTGLGSVPEDKEKMSTDQTSGSTGYTREDDDEKKARLKREHDDRMKEPIPAMQQIRTVLFPQWLTINWLLLAAPVGIGLHFTKVDPLIIFIVNFIAIVPLAGILSFATEEIAIRVGEVLGGLLNASFG